MFSESIKKRESILIEEEKTVQIIIGSEICVIKKQEKSKKQIEFLLKLKQKLANEDVSTDLDSVINTKDIFIKQFEKEEYSSKIVIACLNMICMLIYKQRSEYKEASIKSILTARFVRYLLEIDINNLATLNHNIQSSVCFILQMIYQNNFFDKSNNRNLLQKYKKFSIGFLSTTPKNLKIIFNTLKIIQWMQTQKLLKTEDNSSIVNNILRLVKQIQVDNLAIYQLIFKILIQCNCIQDALKIYKQFNISSRPYIVESLFCVLKEYIHLLPLKTVVEISKEHLMRDISSASLFDFLRESISKISFLEFYELVENKLIETCLSKWRTVVNLNCMPNYLNFLNSIKNKANETILNDAVQDIFRTLFSQISDFIQKRLQEGNINWIH